MFKSLKSIIISLIIIFIFIYFFVLFIINNNPQIATQNNNNIFNKDLSTEEVNLFFKIFIIELILLVRILFLRKKVNFKKIYIRDTKKVIEPILAEAIIDRKIGIKELIMTSIINLINKGNIKTIGNDRLQLETDENISIYEKNILGLIFSQKGQIISFEQIKNVFVYDNIRTKDFANKFKCIKNSIIEKLINDGIYCEKGEASLKRIKVICAILSFFILIFLFTALSSILVNDESLLYPFVVGIVITAVNIENLLVEGKRIIPLIDKVFIGISFIFFIYFLLKSNSYFIACSLLLILNIIIINLTQTHIFTLKGKEEYIKAQCLKDYIEDYGLLEEKDIESSIIWEDYLVYAVAFGISNKVTDKFSESLLNLNLALQKIDRVFRI